MNLSEAYIKKRPVKVYPKIDLFNTIQYMVDALNEPRENITVGTITYNTSTGTMHIYNGSEWLQIASQPEEVKPWRI